MFVSPQIKDICIHTIKCLVAFPESFPFRHETERVLQFSAVWFIVIYMKTHLGFLDRCIWTCNSHHNIILVQSDMSGDIKVLLFSEVSMSTAVASPFAFSEHNSLSAGVINLRHKRSLQIINENCTAKEP